MSDNKYSCAINILAYALIVVVTIPVYAEEDLDPNLQLQKSTNEGWPAWIEFGKLVDDEALNNEFLNETAERAEDWRLSVAADAVVFCRKADGSPADMLNDLLMLERSWREEEELDVEVPEELAGSLLVKPIPGFDPQSPLRHVMARKDRIDPAGRERALLLYTLMTLPSHVPRSKMDYEQMGLKMKHELLCARTMMFLRLAKDPIDDNMKNIMILEIERGFGYLPLRDAVLSHCDDMIMESLLQVQPCRAWGQVLARLPSTKACDILLEWSGSDESSVRTDAYVSLLDRKEKFNEKIVADRVRDLKEKFYSHKALRKKMEENRQRRDEMNQEHKAGEGGKTSD